MKRAAKLGLPVAVHAESETLTKQLSQQKLSAGLTSIRDYLDSRPISAEVDAIRRAVDMAGETGCALHIVHVSSAAGIATITEGKKRGVNVTAETCPHYLTLTDEDVEKIGALAKCAPPLRAEAERLLLLDKVRKGEIDTIGSDHSPSPPAMKKDSNFFKVWGGISGVQHTLLLLLTALSSERKNIVAQDLIRVTKLLSANVAERFRLPPTKGRLSVGADADFALVDLERTTEVQNNTLFYRHQQTPYAGLSLNGVVRRTFLRGQTVYQDGKIVAKPAGHLVKPVR
jgi:allantoinase